MLTFQAKTKIMCKSYLEENKEVKDMIINYITEVLAAKPVDVLQFSINYFEGMK
jgi:hypothetical protein